MTFINGHVIGLQQKRIKSERKKKPENNLSMRPDRVFLYICEICWGGHYHMYNPII